MNKEKLIKAIEEAEKEQEELFVKRVLELYRLEEMKENNSNPIKEGKFDKLNEFLNKIKPKGEKNPYQFTKEEIEERKKNPTVRTLEEQGVINNDVLTNEVKNKIGDRTIPDDSDHCKYDD